MSGLGFWAIQSFLDPLGPGLSPWNHELENMAFSTIRSQMHASKPGCKPLNRQSRIMAWKPTDRYFGLVHSHETLFQNCSSSNHDTKENHQSKNSILYTHLILIFLAGNCRSESVLTPWLSPYFLCHEMSSFLYHRVHLRMKDRLMIKVKALVNHQIHLPVSGLYDFCWKHPYIIG